MITMLQLIKIQDNTRYRLVTFIINKNQFYQLWTISCKKKNHYSGKNLSEK